MSGAEPPPQLPSIAPPTGGRAFGDDARKTFTHEVRGYIGDLAAESQRIALRHNAESVSSAYVQQAAAHLVARSSRRRYVAAGMFGGVFAGGGLAEIIAVLNASPSTSLIEIQRHTAIGAVLLVIGAVMMVVQILKE